MADPGFPSGRCQLPSGRGGALTYDFAKKSRKLYEIERIWAPRGRASLRPLGSANVHGPEPAFASEMFKLVPLLPHCSGKPLLVTFGGQDWKRSKQVWFGTMKLAIRAKKGLSLKIDPDLT